MLQPTPLVPSLEVRWKRANPGEMRREGKCRVILGFSEWHGVIWCHMESDFVSNTEHCGEELVILCPIWWGQGWRLEHRIMREKLCVQYCPTQRHYRLVLNQHDGIFHCNSWLPRSLQSTKLYETGVKLVPSLMRLPWGLSMAKPSWAIIPLNLQEVQDTTHLITVKFKKKKCIGYDRRAKLTLWIFQMGWSIGRAAPDHHGLGGGGEHLVD